MQIWIHDSKMRKIVALNNDIPDMLSYTNSAWHPYLDQATSTFDFTIPKFSNGELHEDIKLINDECFVSFYVNDSYQVFYIATLQEDDFNIQLTCNNTNLEYALEYANQFSSESAQTIEWYLNHMDLLSFAAVEIGLNEISDRKRTLTFDSQETKMNRLQSLMSKFEAEFEFKVELNRDGTYKRIVINIYQKNGIGTDRKDVVLYYSNGLKGVQVSSDKTQMFNAGVFDGKNGVNLANVEFSEKNADGVEEFYSRKGDIFVYAPLSMQRYPATMKPDGQDNWIRKDFQTEYENVNDLKAYALRTLKQYAYPLITYTASVQSGFVSQHTDLKLGDTIRIIDKNFVGGLALEARVSEMIISFDNPANNSFVFTNYRKIDNKPSAALQTRIEQAVESKLPYRIELATTGGVTFKNNEGETIVKPSLYKGNLPYTTDVSWRWALDGVTTVGTQYRIQAIDITDTEVLTVAAYVGNLEVATTEITLTNVNDGKKSNYYSDTFPEDNPKGTLEKGDSLFLTVGDTVKQYYWNGTEWVINPIVSDVEALKKQIAEDLKDVPNREEFENKIAEELANSKAEIETQIETAKTQAESNAKEYADTINQETAKVAEQANTAANEIKADLVNVKNNLTSTSIVANNAQAAVDEAKQDLTEVASKLNTAKQDLASSVTAVNAKVDNTKAELTQAKAELTQAKQDLASSVTAVDAKVDSANAELTQAKQDLVSQAQQLQTQANAQAELTKRVTTVETTANGTKTTVSELSKTVAQNGKDITSVTNRTKTVEDDLASTKTTLTQVQTTANSASQKTATLETGLSGLSAKFSSLKIGATNLLKNSKIFKGTGITGTGTILDETYQGCAVRHYAGANFCNIAEFSNCVVPKVGSTYVASFWAKGSGKVRTYFYGNTNYLGVETGTTNQNATTTANDGAVDFSLTTNWQRYWVIYKLRPSFPTSDTAVAKHLLFRHLSSGVDTDEVYIAGVQLEEGNIATDYGSNEADIESKVAEYKQTADQNYASLSSTVQTLDGQVQSNKTTAEQTAEGFKTRIESLETYKNGESERANAYFESAKTETAKQLTIERTAIANNYVAKSTYTSDVTGIRNELSATTTTANSASQKTAALETGLNGLSAKFDSLKVGSVNLLKNSKTFTGSNITGVSTILNETYQGCAVRYFKNTNPNSSFQDYAQYLSCVVPKSEGEYVASFWAKGSGTTRVFFDNGLPVDSFVTSQGVSENRDDGRATFTLSENWQRYWVKYKLQATTEQQTVAKNLLFRHDNNSTEDEIWLAGVQLEEGNIATGYSPNETDLEQKVAEYKQTADQNYASLQTTVQNLDGTVQHNKTVADQTAQGFTTRIESLETYKDGESTRANQYFESAKTETAKQLTAERTAIAKDYVAKSTYTSDVTGIRNELSATTTTANTIKTNLANYQATNDRAVASLQSSMQTANGNISSLKTKVEAVPGQITSAVSAVESKIPTEIGAVNLLKNSKTFTGSNIGGSGTISSETYQGCAVRHLKVTGEVAVAEFCQCVYPKLGSKYAASFWAKGSGVLRVYFHGDRGYLGVAEGLSSEGNVTNSSDGSITFNLTADWKRYWVKYKLNSAPSSATNVGKHLLFRTPPNGSENEVYLAGAQLEEGNIVSGYEPSPEDTATQISSLSSQIKQTADGITLLATKTELSNAKNELQSGINTATNKANTAQSTANNNTQTIRTHTTQISALNTGLQAKVSQSDFNTLSGRVTTAENNIIAKANELSSKITSVEGKLPSGEMNLVEYGRPANGYSPYAGAEYTTHGFYYNGAYKMYILRNTNTSKIFLNLNRFKIERNTDYTLYFKGFNNVLLDTAEVYFLKRKKGSTSDYDEPQRLLKRKLSAGAAEEIIVTFNTGEYDEGYIRIDNNGTSTAGSNADLYFGDVSVKKGKSNSGWSPSLAELASSKDLKTAQSEFKQTTDSIKASVQSLDNNTVKSSSLTINTDGVVIKAGKSTSDFANAVGSYFSVNQNAINLFSDKINVKGNMIVSGAVTSDKIASKQINTAHLNGKIITADVISSNAVTADAIKAGAVTTDKMSANSINGDRITAGTLDAAKIKAGSITASQIASGTITSAQIKTGTISAANIAAGAITSDKIASNSIDASKIVTNGLTANIIKGGKLQSLSNATNFELDTGKLFYNNNNTGVFRVQDGASTMGLKFSNTPISVDGTSRILSRAILGGDRRETTLDDGKWDKGGFSGIVIETIKGVEPTANENADALRVIADNIFFTHTYSDDSLSARGWKMETYSPNTSYPGNVVLKPYGINYRQSNILVGDVRLDNGDGSGYWMRATINVLKACFGHIVNGGISSDALNAIKSELNKISGT